MNHLAKRFPTLRKAGAASFSLVAFLAFAVSAEADISFTNGGFETTTSNASNASGQLGFNINATGWTTTGYNFLFTPGSASTTGVTGSEGNLQLWGPGNGADNGLTATSPAGGNYIAADGAYKVGAISQTITGLTDGASYTVGFYYAGAQQSGFTSATTEQWQVSFGAETQSTPVLHDTPEGFTGWSYETFTFTADGTSDVLSFLAAGTPNGQPPFALLDGVSVSSATPEPAYLAVGLGIMGLMLGMGIRRSKKRLKA